MTIQEYRVLDVEGGLPIGNHKECTLVSTMTRMGPRKKNGCVGQLSNWTARRTATLDCQWLADNPYEEVFIRPYQPGEFGKPRRGERFFEVVVVIRVGYGQRLRIGFALTDEELEGSDER